VAITFPPKLATVVAALQRFYGDPPPPISDDPFQLILWEQVGYLATDAERHVAFLALRDKVGLTPRAILAAAPRTLATITRLGGSIAAPLRAQRMHESADLVLGKWGGDLRTALALPYPKARRALAEFPMIGEPGADKILAFTGTARLLAMDSNALRVLQRLGFAKEVKDYRASYRAAQESVAGQLPKEQSAVIAAAQLIRLHGQELCRRSAPDCAPCPLKTRCPIGVGSGGA
jgi:endonuclease-3